MEHLEDLKTPTLICQGSRDPFGNTEEVSQYALSDAIQLHWLADGDHSFKPRRASGRSQDQNWAEAMRAVVDNPTLSALNGARPALISGSHCSFCASEP